MDVTCMVKHSTVVKVCNPKDSGLHVLEISNGPDSRVDIFFPSFESTETKRRVCQDIIDCLQREILPDLEDKENQE